MADMPTPDMALPKSPLAAPEAVPTVSKKPSTWGRVKRNPSVLFGGTIMIVMALIGLLAPFLGTTSPTDIAPVARNKTPGFERTIRDADGKEVRFVHRSAPIVSAATSTAARSMVRACRCSWV